MFVLQTYFFWFATSWNILKRYIELESILGGQLEKFSQILFQHKLHSCVTRRLEIVRTISNAFGERELTNESEKKCRRREATGN